MHAIAAGAGDGRLATVGVRQALAARRQHEGGDEPLQVPFPGRRQRLVEIVDVALAEGRMFAAHEEAVVGAASPLRIGDKIHAAHGHDAHQGEHGAEITIVGRMKPTSSPWDSAVVVPIEFTWEVHGLPTGHAPEHAERVGPPFDRGFVPGVPAIVIKPESLIAAYGLRGKYRSERTTAFFPAETLISLYELLGDMRVLMSALALGTQILVIAAVLVALAVLLQTNRRQYAILRALGASRLYIFAAVWLYVTLIVGAGAVTGLALGPVSLGPFRHILRKRLASPAPDAGPC